MGDLTGVTYVSHLLTNAKRGIAIQNDSHLESIGFTGEVVQIECPAGALIMFDCRILHRTLANKSLHPSPLLYYSHARPWFQDVNNFPARSIAGYAPEALPIS
ncbi:hypothetical protein T484DRAFT_1850416 [Baffinella frigidus]|nr:hypothetical protein T484DRAFT_1850416 [Cryptophyta sp. CCMP2293]